MIYEVEGDLMLSRAQVIAHGVSTNDAMTRGFARRLHERYPAMVEAYNDWCRETNPEPGDLWMWGDHDKTLIVNLITHEGDDDPTRVGQPDRIALNQCFRALNSLALEKRFKSIAMPKIGVGSGGLDWPRVLGMLDAQLGKLLIPIFVYAEELDGQVASEPGM